jgi:hypothetical protein
VPGAEGVAFGSRLRALYRLSRLGLYFTMEKQDALLCGDISNAVVDRHFVYGLQAFEQHARGVPEETPDGSRLQAGYMQMALESLRQLNETDQDRTKVQSLVATVHISLIGGFTARAQLSLMKAFEIINKAKLRFFPEYGRPAELSDQVREDVSILSQVIYLENYFYLTLGGPAPVRAAGIEREFRFDLQVREI